MTWPSLMAHSPFPLIAHSSARIKIKAVLQEYGTASMRRRRSCCANAYALPRRTDRFEAPWASPLIVIATYWGLLKQPDKQEGTNEQARQSRRPEAERRPLKEARLG